MKLLRRLWKRSPEESATHHPVVSPAESSGERSPALREGLTFRELLRQLASPDEAARRGTALLLSGLGYRGAVRPLIRAYLRDGDPALLEALRPFGTRLTTEAAREVRDLTLGPVERARLMDILGASGDIGAISIVRPVARESEPVARHAACIALAELGDEEGVELLAEDLLRQTVTVRASAMAALRRIGTSQATAALQEHVRRYLAAGGAIPAPIVVTMPLLVDPDKDLATLIADHLRGQPRSLSVVTGPGIARLAEQKRNILIGGLRGHQVLFTTERHSRDEQLAALAQAHALASDHPENRVALVGPLPAPSFGHDWPPFLQPHGQRAFRAQIILVGPRKPSFVIDWWRYVTEYAAVPTEMLVVLTVLVLGRSDLTAEEDLLHEMIDEDLREAFARAVLAHL